MRICRFDNDQLGVVDGDEIVDVSAALRALPDMHWPLPPGDQLIANLGRLRPEIEDALTTGRRRPVAAVRLLSPVANPLNILGIGINYRDHAEEAQQDPSIAHGRTYSAEEQDIRMSTRSPGAVVGPSQGVALRFLDGRNDHEVELGVVIGKIGTDITRANALQHVAGYCIALDMTLRGPGDASVRKAIDSYIVFGPWLVTRDEITDPDGLEISISVNGATRQHANTDQCRFKTAQIIEHASSFYTLHPGDVIMTGTPGGVSPVEPGDSMVAEIDRIGCMTVDIRTH